MSTGVSNFLATITISQTNESALWSAIKELKAANASCECECRCITGNDRGRDGSVLLQYALDLDQDCLEFIRQKVEILRITLTEYTTSSLGLKVAKGY